MEDNNLDTTSVDTVDNAVDDNSYQENTTEQSSDFSIPDEYKNEGWTKFFEGKSGDELKSELFRSYDNSQKLIGKKIEDYLHTTDLTSLDNYNEIKEALSKQFANPIPETSKDYELNDILKNEDGSLQYEYPEECLNYFGEQFKELGITKEQGQKLLKTYTQFEIDQFNQYTNADDLEKNINAMFANNQNQRKNVEGLIKEFLPQEDQNFLQETAPNYIIEMFYKVTKGLVDKYGFKESSANSTKPAQIRMSEADRNAEYDRLLQQLEELDNRPQKVGERDAIVKRMRDLFQ